MIRIRMNNCIICAILLHLIFPIVINAEHSAPENTTTNEDGPRLYRAERSPDDELPVILEAMIIDENGQYIHLQWEKQHETLANEHLPIWTAHIKDGFTYHQAKTVTTLTPSTRYYDLAQTSAVMYIQSTAALWGAIDQTYSLNGIPLNLLHECHRVGGPYVQKNEASHPHKTPIERPQPTESILNRFENCGQREPIPPTKDPHNSRRTRDVIRNVDLNLHNMTNIRERRDISEKYYVETLVVVTYDIVQQYKNSYKGKYLNLLIRDQLLHFNFIDMLFAKLRTHDLHFYINVAGIIVENDKGAFISATTYPQESDKYGKVAQESILPSISRYLEYHDLPFGKDSVDLIYVSTSSFFLQQLTEETDQLEGMSYSRVDVYKIRQIYNDVFGVPVSLTTFDNYIQKSAVGAREISHALQIDYEPQSETSVNNPCQSIMQKCSHCINCLNWGSESVEQFRTLAKSNKMRCFLLNFPRSLFPVGPRINLTPYQQCQCYGYQSYGKKSNDGSKVPAQDCAQRLQCKNPIQVKSPAKSAEVQGLEELTLDENFDEPTILPLDGTPCGSDKVCWQENCVQV